MKNLKLLLFNNFISLLLLVANNILGLALTILMLVLMEKFSISILSVILIFFVAGITPFVFCFIIGKKFYKKVNKVFCFVSPIAFFIGSLFFDIFMYMKGMMMYGPASLWSGDSFCLYFLISHNVPMYLELRYFFMMSIATTILYYLILVFSNLYKQGR